jgi:hypothetical protein
MELEPSTNFRLEADRRPHLPLPPPVSLVTVEDAHLPATTGQERKLDAFYVELLQFERDPKQSGIVYRAENFRLWIDQIEGPVARDDMRMLGIIVRSLFELERKLVDAEIQFAKEHGVIAGEERLLLLDPTGNWLRIVQSKPIM